MNVRVLIFGPLAQAMGSRHLTVVAPDPATIAGVNEALAAAHPERGEWFRTARLAVNGAFADRAQVLTPDDEVALIEMVSGG